MSSAGSADIIRVTDAVVDELNGSAGIFSQSFTAERKYLAEIDLQTLSGIKVYVVPFSTSRQVRSRNATRQWVKVQIAVLSKVANLSVATVDPLMDLVQEIRDFLRFRPLAATPGYGWQNDQNEPVYSGQDLHEKRQFTSIVTVDFVNTE
jgi:hypothetical protein